MGNEKAEALTNENLRQILLNGDNIPPLEELLAAEISKLERLQKLRDQGKLDFGPRLSVTQLEDLLAEVKEEVDSFLSIGGIHAPHINYNGLVRFSAAHLEVLISYGLGAAGLFYGVTQGLEGNWWGWLIASLSGGELVTTALEHRKVSKMGKYVSRTEKILSARARRALLIPHVGHEYTHHVQKMSGFDSKHSVIKEGHAIGVAKHIAARYSERESNEALLFWVTYGNVIRMSRAYKWICKELGFSPKGNLLEVKTKGATEEAFDMALFGPSPHTIGASLLYLCESVRGPQIYREILQGKFQFAASK